MFTVWGSVFAVKDGIGAVSSEDKIAYPKGIITNGQLTTFRLVETGQQHIRAGGNYGRQVMSRENGTSVTKYPSCIVKSRVVSASPQIVVASSKHTDHTWIIDGLMCVECSASHRSDCRHVLLAAEQCNSASLFPTC
jgi:hypothetical protein|mmetsp:Transcript_30190/g.48528  ORF Transcript_30190/g.48528 Transcript_30190/m.48528 type:complete len:137 (-) Transcript_30190:288-698(-)